MADQDDLDELSGTVTHELDSLDADPQPGKPKRRTTRRARARQEEEPAPAPARRTSTPRRPKISQAALIKDIADEIETYIMMGCAAWSMTDEHCSGVVSEQAHALAVGAATLVARNERMVSMFHAGTLIGDLGKFLVPAFTIAKAIYAHHGGAPKQGTQDPETVDDFADRFPAYSLR